jgi:HTH-type transcriptional regulator/antitoxin HigA
MPTAIGGVAPIDRWRLIGNKDYTERKENDMERRAPAEVFVPGEFIGEELETRGWSQVELAEVMDRPARLISELVSGKRAIMPETAKGLGAAFGTGPEFWMNLERDYRLSRAIISAS